MLKQHSPVEQEERKNGTVLGLSWPCLSLFTSNQHPADLCFVHVCWESCALSVPLFGIIPSWLLRLTPFHHSDLNSSVRLLGIPSHSHSDPNYHHPSASSDATQPSPVSSPGSLAEPGALTVRPNSEWLNKLWVSSWTSKFEDHCHAPFLEVFLHSSRHSEISLIYLFISCFSPLQRIIMRMETLLPRLLL